MENQGVNYWDSIAAHARIDEIWASHPLVRAAINRRVAGDPEIWTTTWFRGWLNGRPRLADTLSVGCGLGNFERDLVRLDLVERVLGLEISPVCVAEATRLAAVEGTSDRIAYRCADAWGEIARARDLDAIFFHASLHHFDRLDEMAELLARALKPGGLLYLDEYVGPARDEWQPTHELRWNWHYYRLPRSVRRVGRIRPPVNDEDPTEAVASSSIRPSVARRFRVLEDRGYGGNLLAVIYGNLRRPSENPPSPALEFDAAVARLLEAEEAILRRGEPSYHAVIVATPR